MPIFPRVIARLKEDDSILGMDDIEYLEVFFAFDGWPKTVRDLLPEFWLPYVASFVKRLDANAARVADRPYVPEMRNPNGVYGLKADDDVIVAFHDHRPAWYWERKDGVWNLSALWATRNLGGGSFVEAGQNIAHRWIGEDRLAEAAPTGQERLHGSSIPDSAWPRTPGRITGFSPFAWQYRLVG